MLVDPSDVLSKLITVGKRHQAAFINVWTSLEVPYDGVLGIHVSIQMVFALEAITAVRY